MAMKGQDILQYSFSSPMVGAAIATAVLACIAALLIGTNLWPIGIALVVYAVWIVFHLWSQRLNVENNDVFFWLLFFLIMTIGFAQKRTGTSWSIVLEGVMLLALPFLLSAAGRLDRSLRRILLLIPAFLMVAILSAAFGESRLVAGVFQIATDIKFPILLLMGFLISWTKRTERNFWLVVWWLWVPLMLLVAWQWVSPSTYFTYIHLTYSGQEDPLGLVPTRALGPYNHSAQFATVLALLFLIATLRALLCERTYYIPAIAYFALLLGTTQRLEIFSLLVAFSISMFIVRRRSGSPNNVPLGSVAALVVVTVAVLAASPLIVERLDRAPEFREFVGDATPFRPRPVYYLTSASIANHFAPLGSGPGTFAGAGAGKFNWDYYQRLGFFGYSWFTPMYMFETYWPHFIAEEGWLGFLIYVTFVLSLIGYGFRKGRASVGKPEHIYWAITAAGLTYLLLTSINGPTFEDPATAFLGTVFLGIACRLERRTGELHGK